MKKSNITKNQAIGGLVVVVLVGLALAVDATAARTPSLTQCKDGIDNDGDTFTDYPADPGCSSKNDNNERGAANCDNGLNDDYDGLVDYPADPGCTSPSDASELGTAQCDNGVDDDNDAAIDYPADSLCSSATDNDEADRNCADTDGGFVSSVQGTVSGSNNGNSFGFTDSCTSSTLLKEFFCSGVNPLNATINCVANVTTSCVNGACV